MNLAEYASRPRSASSHASRRTSAELANVRRMPIRREIGDGLTDRDFGIPPRVPLWCASSTSSRGGRSARRAGPSRDLAPTSPHRPTTIPRRAVGQTGQIRRSTQSDTSRCLSRRGNRLNGRSAHRGNSAAGNRFHLSHVWCPLPQRACCRRPWASPSRLEGGPRAWPLPWRRADPPTPPAVEP